VKPTGTTPHPPCPECGLWQNYNSELGTCLRCLARKVDREAALLGGGLSPRLAQDPDCRLILTVSAEDWRLVEMLGRRADGKTIIVTDQTTGLRWHYRAASCSLPECFCDAEVWPVENTAGLGVPLPDPRLDPSGDVIDVPDGWTREAWQAHADQWVLDTYGPEGLA